MIADLHRRLNELRFVKGVEKVEHVPYLTRDEFWVRFKDPLDFKKLGQVVSTHNYQMIRFGGLPSKLPRALGEVLWDGVTHVIVKKISGWEKFKASLGLEPEGMAKIAVDLHDPYQIFIAIEEDGVQLLYEYLGLKYAEPAPPAPTPAPVPRTGVPAAPTPAKPTTPATSLPQSTQLKPVEQATVALAVSAPPRPDVPAKQEEKKQSPQEAS